MANQRISTGFPFAVYVNETSGNEKIAPGVYVDETSGGGGDVTVAATGVSATGTAGNVTISETVAPSGVSATGTAGSVTIAESVPTTGVSGTGSVGDVGTGQNVSGVSGTGSAGAVGPEISVGVTGVSATGQVGNVDIAGDKTIAITGVEATGQVGSVTVDTGATQTGGHFLPLTEKQLRELKKRQRKERQHQEDLDTSRKLDADSIEASIREKFFPSQAIPQAPSVIEAEESVQDDEEDDLTFILLNA